MEALHNNRAFWIGCLANLAISYNVVNIDLAIKVIGELHTVHSTDESLVKAAAIIGMVIGQVVFGPMGDALGRKRALLLTLLVCTLGAACSALITGEHFVGQLAFWRLVLGIGAGGVYPLAATLARASGAPPFLLRRGVGHVEDSGGIAVAGMFTLQGVGYLVARVTGYALVSTLAHNMAVAWRLLLGLGAALTAIVVAFIFLPCPRENHNDEASGANNEASTGAATDERESYGLRRLLGRLKGDKYLVRNLIGTTVPWFLFDVVFYGNQLYRSDVLEGVFGSAEKLQDIALQDIMLEVVGLPGYVMTVVTLMGRSSPKNIQVRGFGILAFLFVVLGLSFKFFKKRHPTALLGFYGLTIFFCNYGPNSTTFMLPALTYRDEVRACLNGISGGTGKVGAIVGSLFFEAAALYFGGLGPVLFICGLLSLAGGALSFAYVQLDNEYKQVPDGR